MNDFVTFFLHIIIYFKKKSNQIRYDMFDLLKKTNKY